LPLGISLRDSTIVQKEAMVEEAVVEAVEEPVEEAEVEVLVEEAEKCKKCFAGRNGAQKNKRHEQKCQGLKKFECDFCLKILPFKSRLTRHKKTCLKRPL
jgi:hypothetical protein